MMRKMILTVAGLTMISASAMAADMPVKAKPMDPVYNWTGFYVGGALGYGWTASRMSAADRAAIVGTYGAVPSPKGVIGTVHGGYDHQFANRVVAGVAIEAGGFGAKSFKDTTGLAASSLTSNFDWDVALYGRLGYAFDKFMPYVLTGGDWSHNKVSGFNPAIPAGFTVNNWHTAWTVGAGVEVMIVKHWTANVQYRYIDTDTKAYLTRQISGTASAATVGASYRF